MAVTMKRGTVAALTAAAGVAVWATLIERRLFTIRRHTLPVLTAGAAPIRVLHLSDLHLAPWQTQKMNWVRSLAQVNPDLVVLTGDLMGHVEARPALYDTLSAFADTPTVFVHGSNDYYGPILKNPLKYLQSPSRLSTREQDIDNAALTRELISLGFIDLNNAASRLEIRGSHLDLFGLNDPHIHYDDVSKMRVSLAALPRLLQPDASGAIDASGTASGETAPGDTVLAGAEPVRLGVVHAPYQAALNALLDDGADLLLAGHTHGGQVRVPGVGALTSNSDLPNLQARGLSVWHNAHRAAYLNVSAGLGNSIYAPVRFACRPEASLLTLTAP